MWTMKCAQCDVVVQRNQMPFHIRNFHGPRGSKVQNAPATTTQRHPPTATGSQQWEAFRAEEAPPPPDIQEDRGSFKTDIQKMVRKFAALPMEAIEECCQSVENMPALAALYAYTFTHLKLCAPTEQSRLVDLEKLKTEWIRKSDNCLFRLKTVRDELVRILRKTQVKKHICNTCLISEHRDKLHDLDINNITVLIVQHVTSPEYSRTFFAAVDEKAQYMVDTLQNLLMLHSECIEKYRRYLLYAVIRLSRKSGRFPQSLRLRHIQELKETHFEGGFGLISQGKLNNRVVAVKKVKVGGRTSQKFLKDFCNEAVVWRQVQHENCLPFYGVYVLDEGDACLVSPWMTNGHVREYLEKNPTTDRLPLILDVTCGLEYLHSMQPTIIHGDLKGANILITSSGRACLADFGIVIVRDQVPTTTTTTSDVRGTFHFMAPELLRVKSKGDLKNLDRRSCDMYAFGCLCYEMYSGMVPFHDCNPVVEVMMRRRPIRPANPIKVIDDYMWGFIEALWTEDPIDRPTAADARRRISLKMNTEGKNAVRPPAEVEWDVVFLADAAVKIAAEDDPFALAYT